MLPVLQVLQLINPTGVTPFAAVPEGSTTHVLLLLPLLAGRCCSICGQAGGMLLPLLP